MSALQAKTPAVGELQEDTAWQNSQTSKGKQHTHILTVEEIKSAEKEIFKAVQAMAFHEDISTLKSLQAKVEGEERSAARQKKKKTANYLARD